MKNAQLFSYVLKIFVHFILLPIEFSGEREYNSYMSEAFGQENLCSIAE